MHDVVQASFGTRQGAHTLPVQHANAGMGVRAAASLSFSSVNKSRCLPWSCRRERQP